MPLSQRQVLERNARWFADRTALRDLDTGETLTYGELDRRVNRFANALRERGLAPGDRVVLVLDNVVPFPVCLYACHKVGAIPVPLNYRLAPGELAAIFDDTNAATVVYGEQYAEAVAAGVDRSARPPDRIRVGRSGGGNENGNTDGAEATYAASLEANSPDPPPAIDRHPEEPSYMIYTSGTTGSAKGAVHTARSAYQRVVAAVTAFEFHADAVCLSQLPFFHGGGLDAGIRATFAVGGELLVTPEYADAERAVDAIETHAVTHVVGAPTLTDRFLALDDVAERDFSSIEVWYHTGEVLTESRATDFVETLTPAIYNSYGSSEGGFITVLRPDTLADDPGAAGVPTINSDVRVIELDPERTVSPEETVPDGQEGEVIVSGDQLFAGYYGDHEATSAVVLDDWYYTGDLGVVEDGLLTVSGRVDDVIVSGGELIAPAEVEAALEGHLSVEDAVVVGVPDEEWGQRVKAVVVAEGASEEELDEFCRESASLANFKRPREYAFVDEIEYTETGKKRRTAYR